VHPQENANRSDVRWIDFADVNGTGLRVMMTGRPLDVSAWPYSATDRAATTHDNQLPRRDFITVNVDGAVYSFPSFPNLVNSRSCDSINC